MLLSRDFIKSYEIKCPYCRGHVTICKLTNTLDDITISKCIHFRISDCIDSDYTHANIRFNQPFYSLYKKKINRKIAGQLSLIK